MKKKILSAAICISLTGGAIAQQDSSVTITTETNTAAVSATTTSSNAIANRQLSNGESPYKIRWKVDGPVIAGAIGLTALGVKLIADKPDLTTAELARKTADRVPFFDRHSAGWFDKKADDISYPPFQASFALPVVVGLLDGKQRNHYGQIMVMYLETMAITGAMFTLTASTAGRPRPFVYTDKNGRPAPGVDEAYRREGNNQRSFYAGHTASTAAATFFMAKVFHDHHPDSKARTYVWLGAAAVPAFVGYMRHKAGMHFLSDNIVGYAVGAATGILVPHFHKKKIEGLSIVPQAGLNYQGLALTYKL